jgi:hypothetical protein
MRAITKFLPVVAVALLFVIASCGSDSTVAPPVDTVPPVAPVGVMVEEDVNQVKVTWSENAEPDLAGYNVYSSGQEEGPWNKVNEDLLLCPWCYDSPVTMEITYYMITAMDESGNESVHSDVMGIYFSIMGDRGAPSSYVE